MKTLLVIAGMIAGLSAAHAAEKDDLVSIFKSICMGSGPFYEAARDFAQARDWEFQGRSLEQGPPPSDPRLGPQTWITAFVLARKKSEKRVQGKPATYHVSVFSPKSYDGHLIESCWVSEQGLKMAQRSARVDAVLQLPGDAGKIRPDVRMYFGKEGPDEKAKVWSLRSDAWDYVIFSESGHMLESTKLIRLRPYTGKAL